MKDTSHRVPAPPVRAAVTHNLADGADQAVPEPVGEAAAVKAEVAIPGSSPGTVRRDDAVAPADAPTDTVEGE